MRKHARVYMQATLATRTYAVRVIVHDSTRNVRRSTSSTCACHTSCLPVTPKTRGAKINDIHVLTFNKFVAGDALGQSSLVANGLNTHRIAAATCYLAVNCTAKLNGFGRVIRVQVHVIYARKSRDYANLSTWDSSLQVVSMAGGIHK